MLQQLRNEALAPSAPNSRLTKPLVQGSASMNRVKTAVRLPKVSRFHSQKPSLAPVRSLKFRFFLSFLTGVVLFEKYRFRLTTDL